MYVNIYKIQNSLGRGQGIPGKGADCENLLQMYEVTSLKEERKRC